MPDPVVKFIGEIISGPNPDVLWTAAFGADLQGDPLHDRPPGMHLSTIIHYLYERIELPKAKDGIDEVTAKNLKMSLGIAWEHVLSWAIGRVYPSAKIIYPGYQEADGVIMNPDRLDYDHDRLEEWKCTWYSMKKARDPGAFRDFFWWWIMQAQAYCRVLRVKEALFRVMFVNADYAPPRPCARQWLIVFSQMELDQNWMKVLKFGREMKLLK
jgi:hypothetical protein